MTATTFGSVDRRENAGRRIRFAPAEGWTTFGLVLLLCLTLAWSIDDASWLIGPRGLSDFLAWTVALGAAWGFLSAKAGWSRWLAHLLGAVFAALIVPMIVGARLFEGGPVDWYQGTAASVVDAYFDLTVRNLPFTTQIGHFALTLGLLAWATGQFASYATFHHRRPLNGVIIVGIGLVANMSLTPRDQLPSLVISTLAALFLLIRFHSYDERTLWIRHRIGDGASLGGLYLRGGTVFVASAVMISLLLTSSASSAPLAALWKGADQRLIDFGREFQRVFRGGGSGTRINAVDFSGSAVISGVWTTDDTPVMDITVPDTGSYYWRAVTYDRFDGRTWSWSKPQQLDVAAGTPILGLTADDPTVLASRQERTFKITELGFDPQSIFAPDAPTELDVAARLDTVGAPAAVPVGGQLAVDNYFAGLTADASSYTVKTLVPISFKQDPNNGLTENRLRVAGTDYPDSVRSLYLAFDPALVGPATKQLMADILAKHPSATKDPYDLARAITTYLVAEGGFVYNSNVTGIDCGRDLAVECFARTRQGYCEYYASTMALLLRSNGVPVRVAEGFLPGQRTVTASGTTERILKSGSHAWVEVYFPRYGWVLFDPTGGPQAHDIPLPAGPVVSGPPPSARPSLNLGLGSDNPRDPRPGAPTPKGAGAGSTGFGGPGSGPLIAIGVLLAIAMAGLAFLAYRRGPRSASEPDAIWRGVVGIARRFGFAPRPSQTVFEYSSVLGEILPNARPDLQIVARAKVEVAYGRTQLGDERVRTLRDAQRRLRVALLSLAFRRRERRERRTRGR